MATLLTKFSELILQIYDAAQNVPAARFQDAALDILKAHLPFDSSMWGTATMTDGGIDIHSVHLHNSTPNMLLEYEHVKAMDKAAQRVTEQPVMTLSFNVEEDFPGDDMQDYREFLHRFGHRNMFITSDINPYTKFAHWVSLYRKDGLAFATPEEREFLSRLAPHLMQALSINRLLYLENYVRDPSRQRWSVAMMDGKGLLYHVSDRFLQMVSKEYDIDTSKALPQTLLDELLKHERIVGQHVVICRKFESGMLFLKVRDIELIDRLSDRELSVAQLLATGLSKKEVAQTLDRSPETIRSQVKSIFAKLNINTVALLPSHLALRD